MKVRLLRGRGMKASIVSILLALILALIPYLPVVAQDDSAGTITITMTGASEIAIELSPTSWELGEVAPNIYKETGEAWCTLTIGGNCGVNTFIAGEDAVCAEDSTYKWALSSDGNNGVAIYVLWFRVEGTEGDVLIPKASGDLLGAEFYPTTLGPGDSKKFGLKLLTPEPDFHKVEGDAGYFSVGDATMETHVTISAVAA